MFDSALKSNGEIHLASMSGFELHWSQTIHFSIVSCNCLCYLILYQYYPDARRVVYRQQQTVI